jgi:excisionase family DNA binding protein
MKNLEYSLILEPNESKTYWAVEVVNLKGCYSGGETLYKAIQNAIEAIAIHIEGLKAEKIKIPKSEKNPNIILREDEWVKVGEAAKYLGISANTLKLKVLEGQIPAYRPSREYQFRRSDLELYLLESKVKLAS